MYILRLVAGRDPNGCRVYILRLMVGRDPNGCSVHILRLVVGRDPPRWMHILLVSQVHGEPGYRRVRVYILRLVVGRDTDPFVCAYNGYWWAGIPTFGYGGKGAGRGPMEIQDYGGRENWEQFGNWRDA